MTWRTVAPFVLLVPAFWAGWEWRDRAADLAETRTELHAATRTVEAHVAARGVEHKSGQTLANIGDTHEQDRAAAEAVPAAVVADLRGGVLQLRREWAGCETQRLSDAAASAVERDALAADRDALAGAVVRAGRDADDQLRACQAVVRADRGLSE